MVLLVSKVRHGGKTRKGNHEVNLVVQIRAGDASRRRHSWEGGWGTKRSNIPFCKLIRRKGVRWGLYQEKEKKKKNGQSRIFSRFWGG